MSTFAEYTRKKKKKELDTSEVAKRSSTFREYTETVLGVDIAPTVSHVNIEDDIAPTASRNDSDKEDKKWYQGWLKKSEGNFGQAVGASGVDLAEDTATGAIGSGEKLLDALMAFAPAVNNVNKINAGQMLDAEDWKEHDKQKKASEEFIKKDLYNEAEVAKKIITTPFEKRTGIDVESMSVFDEKADSLAQSAGQMVVTVGGSLINPTLGTALLGGTSFGSEMENALNNGATYDEAMLSSAITAGAEILSEKISGGISLGGKTLDDLIPVDKLAQGISNKVVRNLINIGIDATGEGFEEIVSGILSAVGQKMTYMEEKELKELFSSEEALESFLGGAILGGISSTGKTTINAVKGNDSLSGLSKNEKAVFDKVYNDAIAKKESDGKKLTQKEKNKIYDDTLEKLEKGRIDTDTIGSMFAKDSYKKYMESVEKEKADLEAPTAKLEELNNKLKSLEDAPNTVGNSKQYDEIKRQIEETEKQIEEIKNNSGRFQLQGKMDSEAFELLKGTKLAESYNEKARKRQHFEADLTKYDSKQQAVIQQAIDSGILNNTNQTHEFVDWLARVSADKGVSFDFMNNQRLKESGFALEGKTVNGFRKGNNITVNIQSGNELRTVVGHEITHVLEGSPEFYNALASSVKTFAQAKGIYDSMYNTSFENYKNVYKDMTEEEYKKAIEKEVTADLVGEYIFSDADFVRGLSTKNRNVFEKVYDEIKYFLKTVTAGSDAEKQLLKAKKIFEEVYRESNTENVETAEHDDVQYSIEVDDSETLDFLNKQVEDGDYYVTYKSMSFWGYDENGNAILRSPMAEYVDGQLSNAYLIPKDKSKINWYKATETIDEETGMPSGLLVKYRKEGNKTDSYAPASENQDLIKEDWSNLFFNLKKKKQNGKWSDVPARYNPYEHSSDVMLNDQFKTAFERDNLVTVKMIVPKSEDGGAYRAKYSKDATGWTEWKSGDLATQISKQKDFNRNVFLSRYSAPVEIVPDSEVAKAYKEYIEGTSVEVPDNLVPPNLLKELKKLGVPIKESGKLPKGNVQMSISTEYDSLPKPKPSLDPTSAQLQKDSRSVRDVRNDTMLKNDYSIEEVDQTNQFFDEMGEFMKKAGMTYRYIGLEDVNNAKLKITYDNDGNPQKIVLSAMVKNGDYPVNFDFTSICKKRQSISLVVKELAKRQTDGKRTLDVVNMSAESLWKINEELRKEGLETACLGCFVESKRYNIQNFSTKATNMWNSIVNEVRKEQGIEGNVEYFNFAEGTDLDSVDYTEVDRIFKDYATQPNRTSPENRMRALIRSGGAMYQKYLQPSDLMTPEGIEAIKSMSSKKNNFYGILQGVYGQASPKEVMGFSPYNSEIALLPEKKGRQQMAEYIKSIGGVRMQSFSDFLVANVYDYMQMVGDLASRRLPAHAYTKEIAFAKIFGMTGIKVNMSVMFDIDSNLPNEYAGLTFVEDENGDEEYNGVRGRFEYLVADQKRSDAEYEKTGNRPYVQSIPFDEAVALQRDARYSKNVGIIGVGYSDNHILKMLGDDDIRYVIPYHASSLPAIIKDASKIRKATDYTDSQTIRKLKSITDENGNSVDFNEFRKQFGTVAEAFGRLNELVQNEGWQVQYGGQGKSKFNLYRDIEKTNDPRQTVENYLEYCAKNGLMPVFDQFAGHENYYKLIYDFDPYDSVTGEYAPQTAVSNIYDGYDASKGELSTEAIQELIDGEMFIQNEKNRVRNEKIPSVVDSVLDQLGMKEEIQYSISQDSKGRTLTSELDVEYSIADADENLSKVDSYSDYGTDGNVFREGWLNANSKMLKAVVDNREQTKTTQFASWFGDSQVKNASGEPLLVYHGTNSRFTEFESDGKPIWFSPSVMYSRSYANKTSTLDNVLPSGKVFGGAIERVIPTYIKAENPADFGDTSALFEDVVSNLAQKLGIDEALLWDVWNETGQNKELFKTVHSSEMVELLKQHGYDSIKADEFGTPTWAVFESNQAKSAVANRGSFSINDPDIRYSISDENQSIAPVPDGIYGEDIAFVDNGNIAPTTAETTTEEMPIRSDYESDEDNRIVGEDLTKKNADKIRTIQAEIKGHYLTRDIAKKEFDDKIAKKESEYESLNRKDTKKAVDLRNQITNLETRRDSILQSLDNKIERANKRIESIENESRFEKRKTKQKQYRELFGGLMGDTSTWKDKKLGIQYQTNTLRRNLRDIVRDASGKRDIARADALYDELQGSVNKNEAKKNREANEVKDAFREMKINNAESTYIQMLGELRHNPDTTLTQDVVDEFYNKNKGKIDTQKVDKAIEEARKLYDSLYERVNASLSEHGFKEMGYRKGYFPHFTDPKQNWLAKLLNWKVNNDEIPTDIAGITETFEPQRTWQSFDKHRKTDTTDYNFLKGLDNYVNGALDWIYHIEDIQKHRAFETEIRYRHSSEEVQKKIDEYRNNPMLSTEEADTLIQNALREAQNPLNNFVTDLHTRTNILAGKKSSKDRNMESDFNRHAYSFMTNVTNRVTANQVVGSVSSALTNFIPITQSWGQVNPTSSLVGMKQTIQSYMSDDGVVAKSDFLTNRLAMNEALYKDAWDKIGEKVGGLMEIVDNFTSQTIWRSKYYENIKNGMSEEQAIKNADQFAENVIGGRSKGNMPTIFHAKNPVSKMFTSFQLEVANQYGYMFKDMPQDIGKEAIGKLVKGWVTIFVGAYAYNALYSTLTGRDSAFDPFGIIEDFIRDLSGDDDDEEKDVAGAIGNLTSNIVEEIPFVGGLLGGGRIPISSALPYNASIPDAYKDVTEGDWKSVMDELSKPLYYSVLPMGGGQIRKTVQGLSMFDEDLPVSGSYTKSGSLRFPVEDTFLNKLQAGVFGQYASSNAREYFDREQAPLKEKQIQEYIDVDLPISEYWDYREGLKGLTKLSDKADYINSLDLPIDKKNLLVNNQSDREEPIDLTGFNDDFENFEEFDFAVNNPDKYEIAEKVGGYKEYKKYKEGMKDMKLAEKADYIANLNLSIEQKNALINGETDREEPIDLTGYENYSNFEEFELAKDNPKKYSASLVIGYDDFTKYMDEIGEIRADKDSNGKTINGSAKRKKTDYINSLDLDYGQRIILYRSLFDSESDKKMYNADIVEYLNNRDDISYEEMVTILEALDFKVYQDGTVTW